MLCFEIGAPDLVKWYPEIGALDRLSGTQDEIDGIVGRVCSLYFVQDP